MRAPLSDRLCELTLVVMRGGTMARLVFRSRRIRQHVRIWNGGAIRSPGAPIESAADIRRPIFATISRQRGQLVHLKALQAEPARKSEFDQSVVVGILIALLLRQRTGQRVAGDEMRQKTLQ